MPKINVYLPDELAEAVKTTGVPVSVICQRALEQAVRRVTAVRQTALDELTPENLDERFPSFTARARLVLSLAIQRAEAESAAGVGTTHLLAGMIGEGHGLALQALQAIDIEPAHLQRELARQERGETNATSARHFTASATSALELAVTESTSMGHNYIGTEHLLLGLVNEPDGVAGEVLRNLGAEVRLTRRAVSAALGGYHHLHKSTATAQDTLTEALRPLIERIERLERQLGPAN
jgi:ATP-dependent Clp protease ATP-binding subunit ClpA